MTAQDAADSQIESAEGAVLAERLKRVLRASGREAAGGWREGRDVALVNMNGSAEDGYYCARDGIHETGRLIGEWA